MCPDSRARVFIWTLNGITVILLALDQGDSTDVRDGVGSSGSVTDSLTYTDTHFAWSVSIPGLSAKVS